MNDTQDYATRRTRAVCLAAAHFAALDDPTQALLVRWIADNVAHLGASGAREILTHLADYCEFTARGRALVDALKMEVAQ